MYFLSRFTLNNNKDLNDNKSSIDAFNYGKNENMSDSNVELYAIDNSNDFH